MRKSQQKRNVDLKYPTFYVTLPNVSLTASLQNARMNRIMNVERNLQKGRSLEDLRSMRLSSNIRQNHHPFAPPDSHNSNFISIAAVNDSKRRLDEFSEVF